MAPTPLLIHPFAILLPLLTSTMNPDFSNGGKLLRGTIGVQQMEVWVCDALDVPGRTCYHHIKSNSKRVAKAQFDCHIINPQIPIDDGLLCTTQIIPFDYSSCYLSVYLTLLQSWPNIHHAWQSHSHMNSGGMSQNKVSPGSSSISLAVYTGAMIGLALLGLLVLRCGMIIINNIILLCTI